jgi:polysaccharide biosynthesis transport protein
LQYIILTKPITIRTMDLGYLFNILARRKWLIFSVMLLAAAVTFVLIGRKPERYKAGVIISTGIVNYKGINSDDSDAFVQQFQVENAFSNLIEFAKAGPTLKLLTLEMLRRDLVSKKDAAFRQINPKLVPITPEELTALTTELARINLDSLNDPTFTQETDLLIDKISRSMGYDHDALNTALSVKRRGQTDLITVESITESPQLSQHLANTFVNRMTRHYQYLSAREKKKNVDFYTRTVREKKMTLDSITERYYNYLYRKGLPLRGKQSEEMITALMDLEGRKQASAVNKDAARKSVERLQEYITDNASLSASQRSERVVAKQNVDQIQQRIRDLTDQSVRTGGKDAKTEAELASAKASLEQSLTGRSAAVGTPSKALEERERTKESLYKDKVDADLALITAESEIAEVDAQLRFLKSRLSASVLNDKDAQNLEAEKIRAEEDFMKVNDDLTKAKLDLENAEVRLRVVENAQLPEWAEPNRQALLSAFAGIAAGTLATILLFLLAYFDNSLQSVDMFKKFTGNLPLIGTLNAIPGKKINYDQIFGEQSTEPAYIVFREHLRKIRNYLMQGNDRIFMFVSTREGEGKTFTMYAVAHALAAKHKKVLMVDTNFKTPLPGTYAEQPSANSEMLNKVVEKYGFDDIFRSKKQAKTSVSPNIDLLGNVGMHRSPGEVMESEQFRVFLDELLTHYDYIFLEAAALNNFSDVQELLPFADKVVAIFKATSTLQTEDKPSIEYLQQLNGKLAGAILTQVDPKSA